MRILLACLFCCAAATALADFDIERDAADLRRMSGQHVLADLAVGDVGLLAFAPLCRDGRALYVWAMRPLNKEIYREGFKVRREPDRRVSLAVQQDKSSKMTVKQFLVDALGGAPECSLSEPYGPERFQVISIDGATSLSDILAMPD